MTMQHRYHNFTGFLTLTQQEEILLKPISRLDETTSPFLKKKTQESEMNNFYRIYLSKNTMISRNWYILIAIALGVGLWMCIYIIYTRSTIYVYSKYIDLNKIKPDSPILERMARIYLLDTSHTDLLKI